MALTASTLPENTPFPGTVQALVTLLAAYLTAPTAVKAVYVQNTAPTGVQEGTGWVDSTTGEFRVYATIAPAVTPSWVPFTLVDGSVTGSKLADGTIGLSKLDPAIQAIINAFVADDTTTVSGLESCCGGGSQRANFFLMANGSVMATGKGGTKGKMGFGKKGTNDNSFLPKRCGFSPPLGTSKVIQVHAVENSSYALTDDGKVYVTGFADSQQLGTGSTTDLFVFTQLSQSLFSNRPVVALSMGGGEGDYFSSYAVTDNGKLYSWGFNGKGQLGIGSTTTAGSPTLVSGGSPALSTKTVVEVKSANCSTVNTAGNQKITAYVRCSDGVVYGMGWNGMGQLGDGTTTDSNVPKVIPLATTCSKIVAIGGTDNWFTAGFLLTNGTVQTCGSGTQGQIGNGVSSDSNVPVQVKLGANTFGSGAGGEGTVTDLIGFSKTFWAITSTGALYGWGNNGTGAIGDASTTHRNSATLSNLTSGVVEVIGGGNRENSTGNMLTTVLARKSDGTVYACGANTQGQCGLGHKTTPVTSFSQILTGTSLASKVAITSNWYFNASADDGTCSSLILLTNGQVLACGFDDSSHGQLGVDASPLSVSVPTPVNF